MLKTLQKIRRLNHLKRCSLFPLIHPTSVAEHSFHVAMISLSISEELKGRGILVDELKVLRKAITHDIEEVVVSDIPYYVKKHGNISGQVSNFIAGSLGGVEQHPVHDMSYAPNWLKAEILADCDGSLEWYIVKTADLLELSLYCLDELNLGNSHVREMFVNSNKEAAELNSKVGSKMVSEVLWELNLNA